MDLQLYSIIFIYILNKSYIKIVYLIWVADKSSAILIYLSKGYTSFDFAWEVIIETFSPEFNLLNKSFHDIFQLCSIYNMP